MTSGSLLDRSARACLFAASRSRAAPRAGHDRDDPRPPGALLMLLEGRAPLEFVSLLAALPWLRAPAARRRPSGDGLSRHGARATSRRCRCAASCAASATSPRPGGRASTSGRAPACSSAAADDIRALADKHGQPVSLIGWSLGGLYARELAKLHPGADALRRSRSARRSPAIRKATNAWRIYELLSRQQGRRPEPDGARSASAPPVPTTSIYSRSDGIVSWRCSLNDAGPLAENIEVPASHVGMGMNPLALYAVADRLAQPIGQWQPLRGRRARAAGSSAPRVPTPWRRRG